MTTRFVSRLAQNSFLACTAASLAAFALAGCGMGTPATQGPVAIPVVHGTIMGGETPVASSTITMWETDPTNSGYGVTAVPLGAPVTGSSPGGNFSFPTFVCTPGNFIYITSTGGDVSDGGTPSYNPNLVMVAALGSCADVSAAQANLFVTVNELTTVAAAYALGNFINVTAVGPGVQTVAIGAPAANNAATGSCTATGTTSAGTYTGTTCTAAGLAHAFANAANLVSASTLNGGLGNGTAYSTVPGNADGSVPQALINTLGNIMQYCTNSGNTSATDSTISAQCSALFADATPPDGTLPTDTLSALINIAHFPEYAGSTNNVGTTCTGTPAISGGLYCLTNGVGAAFVPQLTAAPHDWSLAIYYSGASNLATSSFGSPQFVTLDANDNVYVLTAIATGSIPAYDGEDNGLAAMTSNGTGLWANAPSTTYCEAGTLATDTNGYVWETISGTGSNSCTFGIDGFSATSGGAPAYIFTASSGTMCNTSSPNSTNCPGFPSTGYDTTHQIQSIPFGIAFDSSNNLWFDRKSDICADCIFELPYISGSPSDPYGAPSVEEKSSDSDAYATNGGQILVDSNLDVFVNNQGYVGTTTEDVGALVLPNTGTLAAPAYINQFTPSTSSANTYSGAAANGYAAIVTTGTDGGGIGLDSSGNLWTASGTGTDGLYEYSVTLGTTPALTQIGSTVTDNASHPYYSEMDGSGIFWYPSFTSLGDIYSYVSPTSPYYSAAGTNDIAYQPCSAPNGATTCSTLIGSGDPKSFSIDSTGSIWMANGVSLTNSPNAGDVTQIIGLASPAWPQMSYGHFGVEPH